ncbi:MAG: hypothetical protein KY468_02630 [Armatimonadetes bacterium]|nr:hypothetical protein [Armatimonadota bacterium]
MDTSYRLRPMDLRDILDDTFDLFKENFVLFVTITALVFLPFNFLVTLFTGPTEELGPDANPAIVISLVVTRIITFVLGTLATYVAMGALTAAVSERYLGRRITVREAYSAILNRFGPFLVTLLLPFFLVGAASFLMILIAIGIGAAVALVNEIVGVLIGVLLGLAAVVAVIYLFFGISFVMPVFIIEGRSGWDAMKRSYQLFTFSSGKVILTLLLVSIIMGVVMMVILGPVAGMSMFLGEEGSLSPVFLGLQGALSGIVQSLIQPIQIIVVLLLYYDVRIRREGYDLEMLANELRTTVETGSGGAPDPYAPVAEEEPPSPVE